MCAWSIRNLACRMQYFKISFPSYNVNVDVNKVENAVEKEISGRRRKKKYHSMTRATEFKMKKTEDSIHKLERHLLKIKDSPDVVTIQSMGKHHAQ